MQWVWSQLYPESSINTDRREGEVPESDPLMVDILQQLQELVEHEQSLGNRVLKHGGTMKGNIQ